jgi:hypothetical protein
MASALEVLRRLAPNGGWIVSGQSYADITWVDETAKVSEAEFNAALANHDAWKAQQDIAKSAQRQALLDKLGITEDEARLLLGGN